MEFFSKIRERMERSLAVAKESGIAVADKHAIEIVDFIEKMIFCNMKTVRIVIEEYSHIRLFASSGNGKDCRKDLYFEYNYGGNRTIEQCDAFKTAYLERLKSELPEIEWKAFTGSSGLIASIERDTILNSKQSNE